MKSFFKKTVKSCLQAFDIGITRYSHLQTLKTNTQAHDDMEMLLTLPKEHTSLIVQYLKSSQSQLRQDLFVLQHLNFKSNGYFVEFGATNGITLSNSYLLEKEFGWKGILAEPAKRWQKDLAKNRRAHIDFDCVWRESGSTLPFHEVDVAELSTISNYREADLHGKARKTGKVYDVKTVSLMDLLRKYDAPKNIDYLSIDTEGSEFEILNNFDFAEYSFDVITCEHNYTPMREKIHFLLSRHGYIRKYEKLSKFDDWYVKSI